MASRADESLTRDWESGRREVLERIDKRYRSDLYDFFVHVVGEPRVAEQLVVDLFAKIADSLGRALPAGYDLASLLYAWARMAALDYIGEQGWIHALPASAVPLETGLTLDIWQAARQMNGLYRTVLALANQSQLTAAQQARALGLDVEKFAWLIGEAERDLTRRYDTQAQPAGKPTAIELVAQPERFHLRKRYGLAGGLFAFIPMVNAPAGLEAAIRTQFGLSASSAPAGDGVGPSLAEQLAEKRLVMIPREEPAEIYGVGGDKEYAPRPAARSAPRAGEEQVRARFDEIERVRNLAMRQRAIPVPKSVLVLTGVIAALLAVTSAAFALFPDIAPKPFPTFTPSPTVTRVSTAAPITLPPVTLVPPPVATATATAPSTATAMNTAVDTTAPTSTRTVIPTVCVVAMTGNAFVDLNGDGVRAPNEPGLMGVSIYLQSAPGAILAAMQTDKSGRYAFTGLPLGPYYVGAPLPPGFVATTPLQVGYNVTGCNGIVATDFGFVPFTPTPTATFTPSLTPTATFIPSVTPTPSDTLTPTVLPTFTPTVTPTSASVAGLWYHNFGDMTLSQNGANVMGSYTDRLHAVDGPVTGTLAGNTLTGNLTSSTGTVPFQWILSDDGQTFAGSWGGTRWCGARSGAAFVSGCGFAGRWNWLSDSADVGSGVMDLQQVETRVSGTIATAQGLVPFGGNVTFAEGRAILTEIPPGARVLYLLDADARQFQGNLDGRLAFCGWRDGSTPPSPCLWPPASPVQIPAQVVTPTPTP